ncbi:MAG: phosphate acyltransferase PlsX [Gemmatimonadetes bacterium]|nr:phosphate acyltransferase PlsX [Gemmatimonadota bacterium]
MTTADSLFSDSVPIAVDAMGGDHGPVETVAGAVQAARGGARVLLAGNPDLVEAELDRHDVRGLDVRVVPSRGVVGEQERPVRAFAAKPDASILVATRLVKEGEARAVVSMGSTGASIAAATMLLGTFNGIERGALGGPIIGCAPRTVVIDLGTSVDARPRQLADFAALGTVMARVILEVENPRVAVLSVGAEEGKGNRLVKETTAILKASGLNFVGNLEASDLPLGGAEVVVCDGFVGNVMIKLTEALGAALARDVRERLGRQGEELAERIYDLTNRIEAYGGGPLLGVRGAVIVGHGRSRAASIAKAIHTARMMVERRFVEKAEAEVARLRAAIGTESA